MTSGEVGGPLWNSCSIKSERYLHIDGNGGRLAILDRGIESPFADCLNRLFVEIRSKAPHYLHVVRNAVGIQVQPHRNYALNSVVTCRWSVFRVGCIDELRWNVFGDRLVPIACNGK